MAYCSTWSEGKGCQFYKEGGSMQFAPKVVTESLEYCQEPWVIQTILSIPIARELWMITYL
jgi:hypothetical protein